MGGMGFRDMRVFNQALLAKQGWRLCNNPDSLLHGILKARYFKNSDFLEVARGYDPSYSWRSIWGAKALLLDGVKWRVGNGSSIKVWEDAWLYGQGAHSVPTPKQDSNLDLRVEHLLDLENGCWNMNVLNEVFCDEDKQAVLNIPISRHLPRDSLYWWPNPDGIYSVRSGYWLGRLGVLRSWELVNGTANKDIWSVIWNLDGPPKLCHFLWRACKGQLAVSDVLFRRHIGKSSRCRVCGCSEETVLHSMFECTYAREIWGYSDFGELILACPETNYADTLCWIAKKISKDQLRVFTSLCWAAWHCRNVHIFEGPNDIHAVRMAMGFVQLSSDYGIYNAKVRGARLQQTCGSASSWSLPPNGTVKLNVDAHVMEGAGVQFGAVIRDCRGVLVAAAVKRCEAVWAPDMAEAGAMRYGVELVRRLGYDKVILESDALTAVRVIQTKQLGAAPVFLILDDVLKMSDECSFFSCNHVKRAGNTVAHCVARYVEIVHRGLIEDNGVVKNSLKADWITETAGRIQQYYHEFGRHHKKVLQMKHG